jgi:D-alanine-D-alanine ligase
MSARRKTTVAVIFGGRSVEHDVSVVTGSQVLRAFDTERYDTIPIYIDREGRWFTGDPLRELKNFRNEVVSMSGVQTVTLSPSVQHHGVIVNPTPSGLFAKSQLVRLDVVFPALHGSHGEDGTLQGLLELADIPYVGCGVLASAVANDKIMTKRVLENVGIRTAPFVSAARHEWESQPDAILERIRTLTFPVFVKPATLGSSIGISRIDHDDAALRSALDMALNLDRRAIIESAITDCVEINCAVMGDDREMEASVLEQPVSWQEFLTYDEKYLRGGEGMKSAERLIPAPLPPELAQRVQDTAIEAFRAIDGRGTARLDFLVRPDSNEVFLNEINTLPGSLAFYLWQEMGRSAREVVDRLVALARDAHAEKRRNTYNYQTNLIALTAARGVKGVKGTKQQRS